MSVDATTSPVEDQGQDVAAALSAREAALREVAHWAGRRLQLEEDMAAAERELEQIRTRSGADILDDVDGEVRRRLATRGPELELTVDFDRAGIAEASRREHAARQAVLRAEADEHEPDAEKARAALAAHERKTERLLAALHEHTGATYRRLTFDDHLAEHMAGNGGVVTRFIYQPTVAERLASEVAKVERCQAILRAVADGQNPSSILASGAYAQEPVTGAELPPSVYGPAPVLAAPGWPLYASAEDRAAQLLEVLAEKDDVVDRTRTHYLREAATHREQGRREDGPRMGELVHQVDLRDALRAWSEAVMRRNHTASSFRVNAAAEVRAILGSALDVLPAPDPESLADEAGA